MFRRKGLILLFVIMAVIVTGVFIGNFRYEKGTQTYTEEIGEAEYDSAVSVKSTSSSKQFAGSELSYSSSNPDINGGIERKIIQSVSIAQDVADIKESINNLYQIVRQMNGYVQESNIWTDQNNEKTHANYVVRIPTQRLNETITFIKDIGVNRSESSNGQDVTVEYIDNEARLKNLYKHEERIRALMDKANKIEELLRIESELARIRTEIEQIASRQKYLDNMTSYATISISLTEVAPVNLHENEKGVFKRSLNGLKENLYDLKLTIENGVIWFITYVPQLIILTFILYLGWVVRRKIKNGKKQS